MMILEINTFTNESLYTLSIIAPPDLGVASKKECQRQVSDERHPLFGHDRMPAVTNPGVSFIRITASLEAYANTERVVDWDNNNNQTWTSLSVEIFHLEQIIKSWMDRMEIPGQAKDYRRKRWGQYKRMSITRKMKLPEGRRCDLQVIWGTETQAMNHHIHFQLDHTHASLTSYNENIKKCVP